MDETDSKNIGKAQKSRAIIIFVIIALFLIATVALFLFLHISPLVSANQVVLETVVELAGEQLEETAAAEVDEAAAADQSAETTAETGDEAAEEPAAAETDPLTEAVSQNIAEDLAWLRGWAVAPWKYLDWFLISLTGVLLYTLVNLATFYRNTFPNGVYRKSNKSGDFLQFTPWYFSTVVKGPIVAVAIMFFLINVDVEISGISLNFSELSPGVLLFIAFTLGFYSRVAREQLDQIVKAIFRKAYSAAEERFSITPQAALLGKGGAVMFRTLPYTEVTWVKEGLGEISANGMFTAPEDDDIEGKRTQIIAIPKDDTVPRCMASVTFTTREKIEVKAPPEITQVDDQNQILYQDSPIRFEALPKGVRAQWQVQQEGRGSFSKETGGEFTLPKVDSVTEIAVVAVPKDAASRLKASNPYHFFVLPPDNASSPPDSDAGSVAGEAA